VTRATANGLAIPGSLARKFRELYCQSPAIFRAPGRVNLIGEHTDYNDGFVMPAAIDYYTWVAAAPRSDRILRVRTEQYQESVEIPLDAAEGPPRRHWSDYARGVARVLERNGHRLTGADVLIDGQVPPGAGLSSSAALELAVALALTTTSQIEISRLELVKLSQKAEHEYAGTLCGIMDQFIAGFGRAGHALMLDCRSLEYTFLPVGEKAQLVVCNSMVRHEHAAGEYNTRRLECASGVATLQKFFPTIRALRDVSIVQLHAHRKDLSQQVYRRCYHVVHENERVTHAANALRDNNLASFGELMYASHASLRDDYEVSCVELDLLVELASKCSGVYGARMTGGGFGGCTVNLVQADAVPEFKEHIAEKYKSVTRRTPVVFDCSPAEGAGEVNTNAYEGDEA
jgi:galactokinase